MVKTNRRLPAKVVLDGAKRHVGKDVVVAAKDKKGEFLLASSMPSGSSQELAATLALVNEAAKMLRRMYRQQVRWEKSRAKEKQA